MFKYLITIKPLGLMYGSAGAFLSPENLVGRSGQKFPPDAATLSGLFFNNCPDEVTRQEYKAKLHVAGAFWAKDGQYRDFYVPVPWTIVLGEKGIKQRYQWSLEIDENGDRRWKQSKLDFDPYYTWIKISDWEKSLSSIREEKTSPWVFMPTLHPRMELDERCSTASDGLFLENAVRVHDDVSLIYLSTHELPSDWYRFGGESHLVEIESIPIQSEWDIAKLLDQKIQSKFALITSAVWGSNRFSYRYPQHPDFPKENLLMLTDKPIFSRFRVGYRANDAPVGGRLGRGRYAVPAGSVYVLKESLNRSWWEWSEDWFPNQEFSLKRMGYGLCLPINIPEINIQQGVA